MNFIGFVVGQFVNIGFAIDHDPQLGCDGLARVDFFLKEDGSLFVNEINTLPGFTPISMYPKMWQASGIQYKDLITLLINFAFEKQLSDNQLKHSV